MISAWRHLSLSNITGNSTVRQFVQSNNKENLQAPVDSPLKESVINTLRPRQNGRRFADDIFKCIFLNEMFEFRLKFHWSLFLRDRLTIFHLGSDNGLAPSRRQAIIWTNDGKFTDAYMGHSASMS